MVVTINKQYTKINNFDEFACALAQIREDVKKLKIENLSKQCDVNIEEYIHYTIIALNTLENILVIHPKLVDFTFGNIYIRFDEIKDNIRKVSTIDIHGYQIFLNAYKTDLETFHAEKDEFIMFDSSITENLENKMDAWINKHIQGEF